MILSRFIGRTFVIVASILAAIAGIVLIVVGAVASPASVTLIVVGVVLIVAAILFLLDALTDPTKGQRIEIRGGSPTN